MTDQKFDTYAVINLFGHQRIAGRVYEKQIGGASFLAIDVPETTTQPSFTRIINPSAVYDIFPVTKEVAEHQAENINSKPIEVWDIQRFMEKVEQKKLESHVTHKSTDDDDPDVVFHDDEDDRGF